MSYEGEIDKHQELMNFFRIKNKDEGEFRDYLGKLRVFLGGLSPRQIEMHYERSWREKTDAIVDALDGKVTADDVEDFLKECPPVDGICFIACCHHMWDVDDIDEDLATGKAS